MPKYLYVEASRPRLAREMALMGLSPQSCRRIVRVPLTKDQVRLLESEEYELDGQAVSESMAPLTIEEED